MARAPDSPPPLPRPAPAGPAPAPETFGLPSSRDPAPGCPAAARRSRHENATATVEEVSTRHVPGTRIPVGRRHCRNSGSIWPLEERWDSAGQEVADRKAPPGAGATSREAALLGGNRGTA